MSYIKSKQILVSGNFDFNNNRLINISDPVDANDAINKAYFDTNNVVTSGGTINGDLTVNGNFYVSGLTTTVDVDNMTIKDNLVVINEGEVGNGVSLGIAGIEIDRGSGTNYQIVFNETTDKLYAGLVGSLGEVLVADTNGNATIANKLYIGDTSSTIYEDGSNNLIFEDAIAGSFTLSDMTNLSLIGEITASGDLSGDITTTLDLTAITNKSATSGVTSTDELLLSDGASLKRLDISVLDTYIRSNVTTTIADATDINIDTPLSNDLLAYNSTSGKWENTKTLTGNYSIIGDLYVSGTTTIIDVDNVSIGDNIILLNSGETGAGVSLNYSGIEIDRGTASNYQLVYSESNSKFVVGEVGSTLYEIASYDVSGLTMPDTGIGNVTIDVNGLTYGTYIKFDTTNNGSLYLSGNQENGSISIGDGISINTSIIDLSATTSINLNHVASYLGEYTLSGDYDLVYKKYVDDKGFLDLSDVTDSNYTNKDGYVPIVSGNTLQLMNAFGTIIKGTEWNFNTSTTNADPGDNNFNVDNVNLSLVTWVNFSNVMDNKDLSSVLDNLTDGDPIVITQNDDTTKFLILTVSGDTTQTATHTHVNVSVDDSGNLFDSGSGCTTSLYFDEQSGIAGHTIRENGIDKTQRSYLNFITSSDVITDDGTNTIITLTVDSLNDVNTTGRNDGSVFTYNSVTGKHDYIDTVYFNQLINTQEANVSSTGQLSTIVEAGYKIDTIIIEESSGNNAGDISLSLTSGNTGEIIYQQTVNANNVIDVPLGQEFFSINNDTDLYISSSSWGSSVINIYFTFKKVI